MEPRQNSVSAASVRHVTGKAVYYLIAAIIIIYFIMVSLSPVLYIRDINRHYPGNQIASADLPEGISNDSLFLALSGKLAFARARVKMAAADSLGMAVNIPDSIITLELKGVVVRTIKITGVSLPGSFRGIRKPVWHEFLADPVATVSSASSIPREPIMLKIAPRDTSEASLMPDIAVDTSFTEPVIFCLEMSNGIRLTVRESLNNSAIQKPHLGRFILRCSVNDMWESMKHIGHFRVPPYKPEIRLELSGIDARVIYRALPWQSQVALRVF